MAASKLSQVVGGINFLALGSMHLTSLKPAKVKNRRGGRGEEVGAERERQRERERKKRGFRGKVLWYSSL